MRKGEMKQKRDKGNGREEKAREQDKESERKEDTKPIRS